MATFLQKQHRLGMKIDRIEIYIYSARDPLQLLCKRYQSHEILGGGPVVHEI